MEYLKTLVGLLLILAASIALSIWGNRMITKARNKMSKGKTDGKKKKSRRNRRTQGKGH
jgi:hypothetical protein